MFWDKVSGVYDLFGNIYNGKVNREMCRIVSAEIGPEDDVLECACGTGMISVYAAAKCHHLIATDYAEGMLRETRKKLINMTNTEVRKADITHLEFADESFDIVIAGNVIHLLEEPYTALKELDRVCRKGGKLIIPTYVNKDDTGKESTFSKTVGKAGADFKRQFTFGNYRSFFTDAGYTDIVVHEIRGRVSCAVAVIRKTEYIHAG